MTTIKATARIEKATGQAILFFHDADTRGVSCYCSQTQHSLATREYYKRDTRLGVTEGELNSIARLVREYNGQSPHNVSLLICRRMDWSIR